MLLFLILLLPCALTAYAVFIKDKKIILPVFAGLITAVVVCACRFFFSYEHRLIYDSFSENFIYYLLKQNLLPLLIVSVVYALVSRDTAEYKVKNFFPLLCSFFAVYLPYCVITSSEIYYQAYDIFLKPVIYLAMLVMIASCLINAWQSFVDKKIIFAILDILIILVYAFFPAVSDALYSINYNFAIILIIGIVYSLIPAALLMIRQIKK